MNKSYICFISYYIIIACSTLGYYKLARARAPAACASRLLHLPAERSFFVLTRRSLCGPDGISLRGALEAGGP